jgi:hypothetical protein
MSLAFCGICLVVALFALIGLMPDFDGWDDGDWERPDGGPR